VPSVDTLVEAMRRKQQNVAYNDLYAVCEHYFGEPRQTGTSHAVFKTPWQGDPRVNIQNDNGKERHTRCGKCSRQSTRRRAM
jgi:hypothetical protein